MRALFDTNVVSYWLADHPAFRAHIHVALGRLGKNAQFYISSVTVQELMVWSHRMGDVRTLEFVRSRFNVLAFDEACALEAARIAAPTMPRRDGTSREYEADKNMWHRDAAIAGTACYHKLDVLLTANGKHFSGFRPLIEPCRLEVVTGT